MPPLRPSEIRQQVLDDHETIRGILLSLEDLSRRVIGGQQGLAGPLRLEGETLLSRLRHHMHWEDVHLRPALLEVPGAWGKERAEELDRDHREQRDLLSDALDRVQDPSRPPSLVARNLLDLVELLRADMEQEERDLLDERVLRDDLVAIDAETG